VSNAYAILEKVQKEAIQSENEIDPGLNFSFQEGFTLAKAENALKEKTQVNRG
jgi:hypothetical protein